MTTLNHDLKKVMAELTASKDNEWNVLTVYLLHQNRRKHSFPSIATVARLATNGNRNKATSAKEKLIERGALEVVPYDAALWDEYGLTVRNQVHQITGRLKSASGKYYPYEYTPGEGAVKIDTHETLHGDEDQTPPQTGKKGAKTRVSSVASGSGKGGRKRPAEAEKRLVEIAIAYREHYYPGKKFPLGTIRKTTDPLAEKRIPDLTAEELIAAIEHHHAQNKDSYPLKKLDTLETKVWEYRVSEGGVNLEIMDHAADKACTNCGGQGIDATGDTCYCYAPTIQTVMNIAGVTQAVAQNVLATYKERLHEEYTNRKAKR